VIKKNAEKWAGILKERNKTEGEKQLL